MHVISNIRRTVLSSVVACVLLSKILSSAGNCVYGYISFQVLLMWWSWLCSECQPFYYKSSTSHYSHHNINFLQESSASTAPRSFSHYVPTKTHVWVLCVFLGVCDALSTVLQPSTGDNYVLAAAGLLVAPKGWVRWLAITSTMGVVSLHESPAAHHLLRGLALVCSMYGTFMNLPRNHKIARLVVSCMFALLYCDHACTSPLRSVAPGTVIFFVITQYRTNPALIFIIASLLT